MSAENRRPYAGEPNATRSRGTSSRQAERARAMTAVAERLDRRGVPLTGSETSEQLADLLEAVERFELTAERAGADLLVDEPVAGARTPIQPDDPAFVLPLRREGESVAAFIGRVVRATALAGRTQRHPHTHRRE